MTRATFDNRAAGPARVPPVASGSGTTADLKRRVLLLVPPLIAFTLYLRALWNGFAWDDRGDIVYNRLVTGPLDLVQAALLAAEHRLQPGLLVTQEIIAAPHDDIYEALRRARTE